MAVSLLSKSRLALLAAFAFCTQAPAASTRPDDYIARAKQLIRKLYPGLGGNLRAVIIDGQRLREEVAEPDLLSNFSIGFHDLDPKDGVSPTACWCSKPELYGKFIFDWQTPNKELKFMTVIGPAVTGRRDKFAAEVDRHPEWSDAKVREALKASGARFGPDHKAELLRELPLEELKPFVGGEIKVVSADLSIRWFGTNPQEASLTWFVKAKWHGLNGQEADCTMALEPFDGKLVSFDRMFN
jgi:hypothetical protein